MVVALFVAVDEWIAWTPEGYYAASFAGERLMGWHINTGPESISDFYPASRFHKSLYRPDVIRRLLEAGNLTRAVELADREQIKKTRVTHVKDLLPGDVKITEPAQSQVVDADGKLTIRASAATKPNQPVTSMRLLVNGRPYGPARAVVSKATGGTAGQASSGTQTSDHSSDIWLPPGKHNIAVKAETENSFGLSDSIEVTRPAGEGDVRPKLHVLTIGGAADAAAAAAIAKALAAAAPKEFGEVTPHALQGSGATPEAIVGELENLRKTATLADTTFVYIAGIESLDGAGQFQISAATVGTQNMALAGLSGAELRRLLSAVQGRIVLATDVKRSQQRSERDAVKNFCSESNMEDRSSLLDMAADDFFRELISEDYGVIVLRTGATSSKEASTARQAGSGTAFSQAFVEAVGGKADEDGDGVVQFVELSRYLSTRVRELSGGKQSTAIERPNGVGSFPIAEPGNR